MKYTYTLSAILFWLLCSSGTTKTPSFDSPKLTNIKQVASQYFMAPQWSPDNNKLLLSGTGYNGVFVIDLPSSKIDQLTNLPKSGYRPTWTANGQQIVFRHKDYLREKYGNFYTQTVALNGKKVSLSEPVHPFSIPSAASAGENDIILQYDNKTLEVWAQRKNSKEKWLVTSEAGQYYYPVLSPDKTKVLVHHKMSMLVFAADGSGLIARLGNGLGGSWSPDSQHIVYFLDDTKDGHSISASELYLTDLNGNAVQLSHTPDILEMWPDWSNDGKRIAFSDTNTGNVFVADLNL